VARALVRTAAFALLAMGFVATFRGLERSAPEFKPPAPSNGNWDSEESFSSGDERPNEPSIFMMVGSNEPTSVAPSMPHFTQDE